jgi:hypothetical protein
MIFSENRFPLFRIMLQRGITGELGSSLVQSYELIGHVVEVVADNLRLRADP